jgi:hypothetical protein
MDNLSKGIRRTWEILIDLIPKIYDTERAVRILGVDGSEKFAVVNQAGFNDLGHGKYDVTVTSGPSFSTQRQEATEVYAQMVQAQPEMFPIVADLMFKAMDYPYSDEMAERFKLMLPPQIQQAESEGKPLPPEAAQALNQAQQMMQQVQEMGAQLQEESAKVQSGKSDLVNKIAELKVREAQLAAQHDSAIADITKREAQLILKQAQQGIDEQGNEVENDRQALSSQVTEALAQMQAQSAQFMADAAKVITQIQAQAQPQVYMQNPPKRRIGRTKRVNGELVSIIEDMPDEAA